MAILCLPTRRKQTQMHARTRPQCDPGCTLHGMVHSQEYRPSHLAPSLGQHSSSGTRLEHNIEHLGHGRPYLSHTVLSTPTHLCFCVGVFLELTREFNLVLSTTTRPLSTTVRTLDTAVRSSGMMACTLTSRLCWLMSYFVSLIPFLIFFF